MCSCQNLSGMKRRKRARVGAFSVGDVTDTLTQSAMLFGGYAAASILNKNVAYLSGNPLVSAGAQIALGVIVPGFMKSRLGSGLGLGMALSGIKTLIAQTAPSVADSIGISGLDYTMPPAVLPRLSGVAGGSAIYTDGTSIVERSY